MLFPRGIIFVTAALISFLAIGQSNFGRTERKSEVNDPYAVEVSSLNHTAPVVGVLLMRLQEIQAQMDFYEQEEAKELSASLFNLSIGIRQTFDGYLYTSYHKLTTSQKEVYTKVLRLVLELEMLLDQAENAGTKIPDNAIQVAI